MMKLILNGRKILLLLISLLIILESLLSMPLPYFSKYLIDDVIGKNNYEMVSFVFIVFSLILFLQIIVGNLLARGVAIFETNLILELRKKIIKKIFQEKFLNSEERSRIQEIVLSDVELYSNNLIDIYYSILSNILKVLICIIIILKINLILGVICLSFIPIYIGWTSYISRKLKKLTYKTKFAREHLIRNTNNILYNILSIKLYNLIDSAYYPFKSSVIENSKIIKRVKIYTNFVSIISNLIISSATFLPLFIGINLIRKSILSIGELIAFNAYIGMLFSPITILISTITTGKMNSVYKERIVPFLVENKFSTNKISTNCLVNSLKIKDLNIIISGKKILEGVSLQAISGDVIKIIGENGSGKTLFLKSLINLTEFSGNIVFNGVNLANRTVEQLNSEIIYVANELGFITGTFYDNLPKSIILSKIIHLVRLNKRLQDFKNLENTNIEDILTEFSSGEIQKLKLARALNHNPKLLLLDEMFSHINKEDSNLIMQNILKEFPEIIIIMVEHHYDNNFITQIYEIKDKRILKLKEKLS